MGVCLVPAAAVKGLGALSIPKSCIYTTVKELFVFSPWSLNTSPELLNVKLLYCNQLQTYVETETKKREQSRGWNFPPPHNLVPVNSLLSILLQNNQKALWKVSPQHSCSSKLKKLYTHTCSYGPPRCPKTSQYIPLFGARQYFSPTQPLREEVTCIMRKKAHRDMLLA